MNFRSGFTIIELLVVIAVIGILTSVILGSLRDARDGGIEAKIKSEMVILGKRASIEEANSFTFDIVCGSNGFTRSAEMQLIVDSIERFSGDAIACNSDTDYYAVSTALSSSTFWCIDSEGASKPITAQLSTTTPVYTCP